MQYSNSLLISLYILHIYRDEGREKVVLTFIWWRIRCRWASFVFPSSPLFLMYSSNRHCHQKEREREIWQTSRNGLDRCLCLRDSMHLSDMSESSQSICLSIDEINPRKNGLKLFRDESDLTSWHNEIFSPACSLLGERGLPLSSQNLLIPSPGLRVRSLVGWRLLSFFLIKRPDPFAFLIKKEERFISSHSCSLTLRKLIPESHLLSLVTMFDEGWSYPLRETNLFSP